MADEHLLSFMMLGFDVGGFEACQPPGYLVPGAEARSTGPRQTGARFWKNSAGKVGFFVKGVLSMLPNSANVSLSLSLSLYLYL